MEVSFVPFVPLRYETAPEELVNDWKIDHLQCSHNHEGDFSPKTCQCLKELYLAFYGVKISTNQEFSAQCQSKEIIDSKVRPRRNVNNSDIRVKPGQHKYKK